MLLHTPKHHGLEMQIPVSSTESEGIEVEKGAKPIRRIIFPCHADLLH